LRDEKEDKTKSKETSGRFIKPKFAKFNTTMPNNKNYPDAVASYDTHSKNKMGLFY